MSPIDDELRAALHGRAQVLAPAPDPLAGIEARARRMQRNRVGAAVAGSALAVGLVAAVVPVIQSSTSAGPEVPRVASAEPRLSQDPTASRYALDPAKPWTYRGDPQVLENGNLATSAREWGVRHGIAEQDVRFQPLYGELYEPAAQTALFYVATDADGKSWWGFVQGSEAGPEFVVDTELDPDTRALAVALPGDEVARLLVVAAPEVGDIQYGPDAASEFTTMESIADGVAVTPLEGDPATDQYRVLDDAGDEVVRSPAPDPGGAQPTAGPAALDPAQPWEVRGDLSLVSGAQLDALGEDWAQRHGVDADAVQVQPLYVQEYDVAATVEVVYLVRFRDNPWMWGVSSLSDGRWSWYADNELAPGTTALAAALPGDDGLERLLVVAAPSTGGAEYARDGQDFQPMTDLDRGVFFSSIFPGDADDRYKVLDGDGDLDDPVFAGPAPDYQNAG